MSPGSLIAYVGVDPGQTGAIAVLPVDGSVELYDWPADERVLAGILDGISLTYDVALVRLEYQQAMPLQGVTSVFSLGVNYGTWLGLIAAQRWPLDIVRPAVWRTGLGYPSPTAKPAKLLSTASKDEGKAYKAKLKMRSREHKTALKQRSLTLARRLYPCVAAQLARQKDHGRAEALLIAHSAREARR